MKYLKIISAQALDNYNLIVEFDNGYKKKYDITSLLDREMFSPLKNPGFFKNVRVETGGYAIMWNENIDLSEYELWVHGTPVSAIAAFVGCVHEM